jgi:hypothetical protein
MREGDRQRKRSTCSFAQLRAASEQLVDVCSMEIPLPV